jgi:PAT family beta-lactamase induction signal transducer AmpG
MAVDWRGEGLTPTIGRPVSTLKSRRVQVLGLLSISSGMPLGFVTNTLQIFLRGAGVSLKEIGLLQSISLPWTLKFLWSPLVDRYALRWPGRRRSWLVLTQLLLAGSLGILAGYVGRALSVDGAGRASLMTGAAGVIAAIGLAYVFIAATQDIALDAYAVEVLDDDEVGPASGLRIFWYRIGMLLSGALAVFASQWLSWPVVFTGLGVVTAACVGLTLAAPEPARPAPPPRSLASAVWGPLSSYFRRPDAWTVGAFLVLYKFGDNLALSMVNPFLKDLCFSNAEIGLVVKTIGTASLIGGATAGGLLTAKLGLGRALWVFGVLQAVGSGLYALVAFTHAGPVDLTRCGTSGVPVITYATTGLAIAGEYAFQGMATAAVTALMMRLCEKRYGATQYALLSSLFGLGRVASGPPSGWLAEHLGYGTFFLISVAAALPGLVLLQLVSPLGSAEPRVAWPEPPPA